MDLPAYISVRKRSIDLRWNLWSVDIEQCVMHALPLPGTISYLYSCYGDHSPIQSIPVKPPVKPPGLEMGGMAKPMAGVVE